MGVDREWPAVLDAIDYLLDMVPEPKADAFGGERGRDARLAALRARMMGRGRR